MGSEKGLFDPTIAPGLHSLGQQWRGWPDQTRISEQWKQFLGTDDDELVLRVVLWMRQSIAHLVNIVENVPFIDDPDRAIFRSVLDSVGNFFSPHALGQPNKWAKENAFTPPNMSLLLALKYTLQGNGRKLQVDEKVRSDILSQIDQAITSTRDQIDDPLLNHLIVRELMICRIAVEKLEIIGIYGVRHACASVLTNLASFSVQVSVEISRTLAAVTRKLLKLVIVAGAADAGIEALSGWIDSLPLLDDSTSSNDAADAETSRPQDSCQRSAGLKKD